MKISEILWKAANECLSFGAGDCRFVEEFSCHAAMMAEHGVEWRDWSSSRAVDFMEELGCPCLSGWHTGKDRDIQQARYAWLMFASMYAEELGI